MIDDTTITIPDKPVDGDELRELHTRNYRLRYKVKHRLNRSSGQHWLPVGSTLYQFIHHARNNATLKALQPIHWRELYALGYRASDAAKYVKGGRAFVWQWEDAA